MKILLAVASGLRLIWREFKNTWMKMTGKAVDCLALWVTAALVLSFSVYMYWEEKHSIQRFKECPLCGCVAE